MSALDRLFTFLVDYTEKRLDLGPDFVSPSFRREYLTNKIFLLGVQEALISMLDGIRASSKVEGFGKLIAEALQEHQAKK